MEKGKKKRFYARETYTESCVIQQIFFSANHDKVEGFQQIVKSLYPSFFLFFKRRGSFKNKSIKNIEQYLLVIRTLSFKNYYNNGD